ncbi:MAG TPA: hypothetical protein PLO33_13680 [Kouleothrix sp.]|uniref:hypothetical protein n=1 Tax=Kouleothrix sp. TaxID=2779161 RepID=UPI002CB6DC94|nr:hypothetical protein [Kouleothrix sp.]
MITDQNAVDAGWYFDQLHQQPVYLFWDRTAWRARFVWQEPLAEIPLDQGGKVAVEDALLTADMYHRLIPLGQAAVKDYTSVGGSALRELYGLRRLVQVKPALGGHGVFIQAPAAEDRGQCDPLCQAVWLSDDEIPTIIRALQARRRMVLDSGKDPGGPPTAGDS